MFDSEVIARDTQDAVVGSDEKVPTPGSADAMQSLLGTISKPWTLQLAWTMFEKGPLRFGELRRRVAGISAKVLTERLRMMEREGLTRRIYVSSVPPKVTYEPTKRLNELGPVLKGLEKLAEGWYGEKNSAEKSAPETNVGAVN